ncbi:MAG: polysaccharide biosynthesis tyrosine autokinase [Firmicutes bacterium]|nr:polysaccharide biosynthesis tyrosine autokinase [Bacillota bacterium]MCM1401960.1 polysaccharide biosynthesis tyrosine autokinase [Bacteroides sp.]MCM1477898.1 polysaccharide biosynthesis tyrosine autokinase [Bacteroides sp.]
MSEEEKAEKKADTLSQVKITDVIFITLKRWPWLLLSLVVCVGLAQLYIMRTPPVYTRTASVVIKDESKGGSVSGAVDFASMGLVTSNSNVQDEINKLQSPDVIEEAVRRLNLNKVYYIDGKFRKDVVYGPALPINVKFPSLTETGSAAARIEVNKDGTYTVTDLLFNGESAKSTAHGKVRLGQPTPTTGGAVEISTTPYYVPGTECDLYVTQIPVKSAVGSFLGKLSAALKSDKGSTINITVVDESTQRAEDLINTIIDVYNEKWIENRNQIAVSTSNFITERLGVIESELGNVDRDISSYQSEHLIPDVQAAANIYMSENQTAAAQILNLTTQLQMTRYLRSYLGNEVNKNNVLPANSGINNGAIESQIGAYNTLMLQRNQLESNSSDSHPVVSEMDTQLAAMRSSIISSVDNQITALETEMRNLQGSKAHATEKIAASPAQAKDLLSMERQQKVKESLYLFLLQKREENELSQAFTAYNTQVVNRPTGTNAPSAPVANRILMMGFALGLIIPFGVTYVLEISNTRVRGRKDVEDLKLPFIGEIPMKKTKKGEKETERVVVKQGKRDVINEAFRVLRTNLSFMSSKEPGCKVIMVTSFNPGSGKTFITFNLGVSLAINGKRVLIIDGDMRRGSTSAYVNSPSKGMSNYLVGETDDVNSLIVNDSANKRLSVLPVGTIPPNPTELLETPRFSQLISKLRGEYDYIFIDCPPVEMMADAQIINTVVDRTIFVIRAGLLERSMLPELNRLYEEKKFVNMGIVLNATEAEGSRYGYKYGYGYGYGYGNYSHYTSTK